MTVGLDALPDLPNAVARVLHAGDVAAHLLFASEREPRLSLALRLARVIEPERPAELDLFGEKLPVVFERGVEREQRGAAGVDGDELVDRRVIAERQAAPDQRLEQRVLGS